MRCWKIALLVSVLCLTVLSFTRGETVDRIVAKVGDEIILESELAQQVAMLEVQMQGVTPDSSKLKTLRRDVLEQMIENKILLAEAKKESLEVKRAELNDAVDRAIGEARSRFSSPEDFEKRLKEEGLDETKLRKQYEDELRDRLLVQKLIDKNIKPKVEVSPKEVEEFYKTHRDSIPGEPERVDIAHVLVTVKPGEEEIMNATKKLAQAQTELKKGVKFAIVAKKYSEDPGSSANGGDLGFFHKGEMVPEFEQAAFALKPGQTSDIVQTRYGLHILRLTEQQGDSIRVSHILVRVTPSEADIQRAKKVAQSLRDRIAAGENFAKVAQSYSDDLDSKDKGGNLGKVEVDRLPPAFKDAVAVLKEGEVSEVVRTEYGFHILKLIKREPARTPTYEEIKEQLTQYLTQQKMEERYQSWMKELKKKTFIENTLEG